MKHLIVSADDFGLTKSVNEGIIKAREEGIVSYLNILPAGEAFDDAIRVAKNARIAEMGAHLSLTEINASYKGYKSFFLALLLNNVNLDKVYVELKDQLERLKNTGIRITGLSSHEHIHIMPRILGIFVRLAKEYNIPCVRCLHGGEKTLSRLGIKKIYKRLILSQFAGGMAKMLKSAGIFFPDNLLGFLDSGGLTEEILAAMLKTLPDGVTELVCHPGFLGPEVLDRYRFHVNCEGELFALTSRRIKNIIIEKDIKLIAYSDLATKR